MYWNSLLKSRTTMSVWIANFLRKSHLAHKCYTGYHARRAHQQQCSHWYNSISTKCSRYISTRIHAFCKYIHRSEFARESLTMTCLLRTWFSDIPGRRQLWHQPYTGKLVGIVPRRGGYQLSVFDQCQEIKQNKNHIFVDAVQLIRAK